MRRINFLIFAILLFSACSKEYNVGKIFVVDETQSNKNLNISEIAEKLLRETRHIGVTSPEKSDSTLKITLSEINVSRDKSKVRNRFSITLTLTASDKNKGLQIFQSDSIGTQDINLQDPYSQIKVLLYDAILKLDYQCNIRKHSEDELIKFYEDKKTAKWQRETIIDEIGNRLNTNLVQNYDKVFNFLYSECFLKQHRDYGDKVIGILSSSDFSRFRLSDRAKNEIPVTLAKYSLEREPHIQIHTISILAKIDNDISRSIIFTLSTGSTNRNVREHAKEVLSELKKRNSDSDNIVTAK